LAGEHRQLHLRHEQGGRQAAVGTLFENGFKFSVRLRVHGPVDRIWGLKIRVQGIVFKV